ncbi:MAG: amidohydrolase family protein, partial [Gemmatimonadaceae bacterium]
SQTIFDLAEMVEAGTTLGPRIYSTGDIFFVSERVCCGQVRSLDDARAMVKRQKALGATSIKEHTDPRREQVQWIIQASREEGLMAVMDPAHGPRRELRTIMDGATSLEHLYAVTPVKKDVIEVFAKTGAWYVPTLVLSTVEDYYMTSANPHDDAKARRFIPHMKLDRDIHNYLRWRMPHEWPFSRYGEVLRDIVRAGGKVGMGSHGQVQGLGAHWEMWAMASGGLTPHEVLWASTLSGAEGLGLQDDLGSLEAGKIADLLVLDRNPLTDIKNTNSISYVMKGGVLWNGDTMDEVWPTKRTRPPANWEGMFRVLPEKP